MAQYMYRYVLIDHSTKSRRSVVHVYDNAEDGRGFSSARLVLSGLRARCVLRVRFEAVAVSRSVPVSRYGAHNTGVTTDRAERALANPSRPPGR